MTQRHMEWIAAALLAVSAIAASVWRSQVAPAHEYVTVAVDRGTVAPTVTASGTLNPVTTVQVGSYVSGVIQTLSCDFNTRVSAGQLCAMIDPRPYQSVVDQDRANLATARAQLEKDRAAQAFAKLIFERDTDLIQRNIVSRETVDTARNAYAQAQSQIALDEATVLQRQAVLDAARINLGYTRIVSPVSGTVVSRNVTQGQTVAASFQTPTLFLIATDLTKMQVDTNVSESDIGRIQVGNAASFTVEAFRDRQFAGVVKQVRQAPQTVQNVITYDVVIGVDNPELLLKPGMTAAMHIVTERRDQVLRVPDQALRYVPSAGSLTEDGSGGRATPGTQHTKPAKVANAATSTVGREAQVWTRKDGRLQRIPIAIGLDDDSFAEVLSGDLHAGDALVVSERAGQAARSEAPQTGPRLPRL